MQHRQRTPTINLALCFSVFTLLWGCSNNQTTDQTAETDDQKVPFQSAPDAREAPGRIVADERGFTLTMDLPAVLFDTDSAAVHPRFQKAIADLVHGLRDFPELAIEVAGHTDSVGNPAYNQRLSQRRAEAVATIFGEYGFAPERLRIQAHGQSRPIASNESEEGRRQNRRAELSLLPLLAGE